MCVLLNSVYFYYVKKLMISGRICHSAQTQKVIFEYKAVDSISKPGGPSSKESASNEAFHNFYL